MGTGEEKVMLITGASTGIGRATALLASERGYRVALTARSADKLGALVSELGEDRAAAFPGDIQDEQFVRRLGEQVLARFGRIDVLFANAGIGSEPGGLTGAPPDSWRRMLMTNVFGLATSIQATAAAIRESRGHVVITSSTAGRRTLPGSVYSATKWAATAIGHALRKELDGTGVRVTLIEPGLVSTPFFDAPKPEMLQPEDVARAVLFALEQPPHVEIHELMIVPTKQGGEAVP